MPQQRLNPGQAISSFELGRIAQGQAVVVCGGARDPQQVGGERETAVVKRIRLPEFVSVCTAGPLKVTSIINTI